MLTLPVGAPMVSAGCRRIGTVRGVGPSSEYLGCLPALRRVDGLRLGGRGRFALVRRPSARSGVGTG